MERDIFEKVEVFQTTLVLNQKGNSVYNEEFIREALKEELHELESADCEVDAIDAIIDLIYFSLGFLHRVGLTAEEFYTCFDFVHKANMHKLRGAKEVRSILVENDAYKPDGWKDPKEKIAELLNKEKENKMEEIYSILVELQEQLEYIRNTDRIDLSYIKLPYEVHTYPTDIMVVNGKMELFRRAAVNFTFDEWKKNILQKGE